MIRPLILGFLGAALLASPAHAAAASVETEVTRTALLLTLLAIIPALIVSATSFLRIVIVLSMVRHAFGMPQTPPNVVLTSLALFKAEAGASSEEREERQEPAQSRPQGQNQQAVMKALKQAKGEALGLTRLMLTAKIDKSRVYEATAKLIEKDLIVATETDGGTKWSLA